MSDQQPIREESALLLGTVVAVQANYYQVQLDQGAEFPQASLLCLRRARLKKIGQRVMVGDRVGVEEPDWMGGRGAIAEVLPRSSALDRPPIANAQQILLVFALAEPQLDPYQLTRFLIKAESTGLEICLCLNKCDLISAQEIQDWGDRIRAWGYQPIFISVKNGIGLEQVQQRLSGKITIFAGMSGVGKSSLINALIPEVELRVAKVSGKLSRGRHTTRHVELFELPTGGLLADSPGFNQPDLDCAPQELAELFPEARTRLQQASCQFSDCLHRDEPNCVVRDDWERYDDYLIVLDEALERQDYLKQQTDPDATFKVKTNRRGKSQHEPRLEAKKYRRQSRRSQNQALDWTYQEMDE